MKSIHTQKTTKITFASVTLASVLCAISIIANASAEDLLFTVTNNAVIQLTVPSLVNLNLYPTTGSDFNTASMDISVGTNNPTGYTLTMTADSDTLTRTSSITDGSNNTYTPTILPMLTTGSATGYTAAQFESSTTDAYTLNRWGYKLSTATNFMPMTTTTTELSTTNAPSNGDTVTLDFAAKVDTTKPAGTYQTTLNFIAVTNAAAPACDSGYAITFMTSNAESIVFNGVSYANNDVACMPAGTYHIYGNYATRYAFSSWNITGGTLENSDYQNTAYTVNGDATITLTGQQVTTAMQNLPSSSCTTTAMPVYDNRDDSVYWIQKLPDDNCWMLDNIALDLTNSTIVNALSTTNTHLDATSLTYFKNGGGTTSDRYPITGYDTFGSTNSCSQPLTNMDSKSITLRPSTATDYTDSIAGAYGLGQGKIGAYYNYCAASVGYYCFGNGTSAGTSSGNNDYDVCPAGWRMPTGASAGEYETLYTNPTINSDATNYRNSLSVSLSGSFRSGSANGRGSYGDFWSSTRSNNNMYYMSANSSNVYLFYYYYRYGGFSVRCVLGS